MDEIAPKRLIVNADDFGVSSGINRGIIYALVHGIVTSASLMVRQSAAREAAQLAHSHPRLCVGLHVDLGEWIYADDQWQSVYSVVATDDARLVEEEVERQLASFESLLGRLPAHLDSHQHVHRDEPVRSVMLAVAQRLNIPLRHESATVRYCGDFYGQGAHGEPMHELLAPEALVKVVDSLTAGTTELGCHPGYCTGLVSSYRAERELELAALCSPTVRKALESSRIELMSFEQLAPRALERVFL
jgi:predicted glycoside hydrolase/deacetylase ChbG (UPF0249 family)